VITSISGQTVERLQAAGRGRGATLRASIQSIGAGIAGQALLVVSGPLVARMLGVDGRGELAGLLIWPAVLSAFGSLGIPAACTYFLSNQRAPGRNLLGEAYRLAAVQATALTALLAAILFVWVRGRPHDVQVAAIPITLLVAFVIAHSYGLAFLQGQHRFTAFNICRTVPGALYAVAAIILFLMGIRRLEVITAAWVLIHLVAALAANGLVLARMRPDWTRIAGLRRSLLAFGVRGLLGSISPVDSLPVDQAAIALFLSPAVLGLYVVGTAFTNLPRFLAQSVGMIAYPAIAAREGRDGRRLMWWFFWGVTLLNLGGALVLILLMPVLIHVFYGSAFAGAIPIAQILLIGTTLVASRRVVVEGLRGLGRPGASTIAELSMYPWLVVGAPLLMLRWGAPGLAAALSVAYGLSLLTAILLARQNPPVEGRLPRRRLSAAIVSRLNLSRETAWHLALIPGAGAAVGVLVGFVPWQVSLLLVGAVIGIVLLLLTRRLLREQQSLQRARGYEHRPSMSSAQTYARSESEGAAPLDLRLPRLFYYCGMLCIAQLTIRPVLSFTLSDWFFLAALLTTGAQLLLARRSPNSVAFVPVLVGIGVFSIAAFASSFGAVDPLQSLSTVARLVYLTVVWFWLGTVLLRKPGQVKTAVILWVASVALSGAAAIAQLLFGNVIPGGAVASWGRDSGFAQSVTDLGGMTAAALVPALMVLAFSSIRRRLGLLVCGCIVLILAGLMLSGSVGSLLAAGVAIALWAVSSRLQTRLFIILCIVGLGGFLALSAQQQAGGQSPFQRITTVGNAADPNSGTIWSRVATYQAAWERIQENPLIGVGLDSQSAQANAFRVHDVLLGAWYETGLVGAVGVFILLVSVAVIGRRTIREARSTEERALALALLLGFAAFVVYLLGEPFLYERYGWVSVALLLALRAQQRRTLRFPEEEPVVFAGAAAEERSPASSLVR
jgi:O-antigen ligase/O-antigen/teichoic acid export membrane protein